LASNPVPAISPAAVSVNKAVLSPLNVYCILGH
jgi:hypothetical protein